MSDAGTWNQRLIKVQTGVRVATPAIQGPQEATITKVGTAMLSIDGQTARDLPVVWFFLPNTIGNGPGFGPAPYQPVPGWTPSVGDPCLVVFAGNGVGRPYVVCFPTAVPT